jgi:hypothetical protein
MRDETPQQERTRTLALGTYQPQKQPKSAGFSLASNNSSARKDCGRDKTPHS